MEDVTKINLCIENNKLVSVVVTLVRFMFIIYLLLLLFLDVAVWHCNGLCDDNTERELFFLV